MAKNKTKSLSKIDTKLLVGSLVVIGLSAGLVFGLLPALDQSSNYYGYGYGYGYGCYANFCNQIVDRIVITASKDTLMPGEKILVSASAFDIKGNLIDNPVFVTFSQNGSIIYPYKRSKGRVIYTFQADENLTGGVANILVRAWPYPFQPLTETLKEFKIEPKKSPLRRIFLRR